MGSLRTLLIAAALLLSACATAPTGTSNSWCETHSKEDFIKTPEERAAQTPDEKRQDLNDLNYGALACGWKP